MKRFIGVIRTPQGWNPVLYHMTNGVQSIREIGQPHNRHQYAMADAITWHERTMVDIDFGDEICYTLSPCISPTPTFIDNAGEVRCQRCNKLWFF